MKLQDPQTAHRESLTAFQHVVAQRLKYLLRLENSEYKNMQQIPVKIQQSIILI